MRARAKCHARLNKNRKARRVGRFQPRRNNLHGLSERKRTIRLFPFFLPMGVVYPLFLQDANLTAVLLIAEALQTFQRLMTIRIIREEDQLYNFVLLRRLLCRLLHLTLPSGVQGLCISKFPVRMMRLILRNRRRIERLRAQRVAFGKKSFRRLFPLSGIDHGHL